MDLYYVMFPDGRYLTGCGGHSFRTLPNYTDGIDQGVFSKAVIEMPKVQKRISRYKEQCVFKIEDYQPERYWDYDKDKQKLVWRYIE